MSHALQHRCGDVFVDVAWYRLRSVCKAGVWLDEGGERSGLKGEAKVHRFDRVTDATDRSEIDDPPIRKNKHGSTAGQA